MINTKQNKNDPKFQINVGNWKRHSTFPYVKITPCIIRKNDSFFNLEGETKSFWEKTKPLSYRLQKGSMLNKKSRFKNYLTYL